jgi:hypothetical protein
MKIKDIVNLNNMYLKDNLKSYTIHRDLVFKVESDFFLKSYYFESRGNGESDLAVWWFIQPLYLKDDDFNLTFGDRLTHKEKRSLFKSVDMAWWDARKEHLNTSFQSILQAILNNGEKRLSSFKTPADFYKEFKPSIKDNIRIYEGVAYTTILMHDKTLQDKMLQGLIDFSLSKINRETEWVDKIREDATLMVQADTQEKRLEILKSWANVTINHLKLPSLTPFI